MLPPLDDVRKQKFCEMYKSGAPLKEIQEATIKLNLKAIILANFYNTTNL